jgi:hypothetical protein
MTHETHFILDDISNPPSILVFAMKIPLLQEGSATLLKSRPLKRAGRKKMDPPLPSSCGSVTAA